MINFVYTDKSDIDQLTRWIQADPWHSEKDTPEWWLSSIAYLTFKLTDAEGTVLFVRLDQVGDTLLRLHSQFGPISEVSEKRTALGILYGINNYIPHGQLNGVTGLVTESTSPRLINFLIRKLGFEQHVGNDYKLNFSGGK